MYLQQLTDRMEENERVQSIDFDWRNPSSSSRVGRAVRKKNYDLVKSLIEENYEVNAPDNRGYTPLHDAAMSDDCAEIAELLLEHGAYVEHRTVEGETPLFLACKKGSMKIVEILLKAGCDVNAKTLEDVTPLHTACLEGKIDVIKNLLENGANLEARDFADKTPLFCAIVACDVDALNVLLEAGANVHVYDSRISPLHLACILGEEKIFDALISRLGTGPEALNRKTRDGRTCLMEATQCRHYNIAKKLIEYGSDTSLVDERHLLALHLAAHSNMYSMFELLLKNTPEKSIEEFCSCTSKNLEYSSLPCLLIDKGDLAGLKLLFESISNKNVLNCPIKYNRLIYSPISYLLELTFGVKESKKIEILKFLLDFQYLLDPQFPFTETLVTDDHKGPLSSESYLVDLPRPEVLENYDGERPDETYELTNFLIISPVFAAVRHHNNTHKDCRCSEMLSLLLEKGGSPDSFETLRLRAKLGKDTRFILYYECILRDWTSGLELLINKSQLVEPGDVLLSLKDNPAVFLFHEETVKFLIERCTFEVHNLARYFQKKVEDREGIWYRGYVKLYEWLREACTVPPLKKICKSVLRQQLRTHRSTSLEGAISSLPLPPPLVNYLIDL